jgi:hypothetical protein
VLAEGQESGSLLEFVSAVGMNYGNIHLKFKFINGFLIISDQPQKVAPN